MTKLQSGHEFQIGAELMELSTMSMSHSLLVNSFLSLQYDTRRWLAAKG